MSDRTPSRSRSRLRSRSRSRLCTKSRTRLHKRSKDFENLSSDRHRRTRDRSRSHGRRNNISPCDRNRNRHRRDISYDCQDSSGSHALGLIMTRLSAIEDRLSTSGAVSNTEVGVPSECPTQQPHIATGSMPGSGANGSAQSPPATQDHSVAEGKDTADKIVGALASLIQVRSNHFYISNFDPAVHDFDVWCAEVDKGREINHWDDRECLARIGRCLRGSARAWLDDWVTSDRTWSNFKLEFKSLCPRNIDIANILFEVMCSNSNQFETYADFARKSLLRLNIVSGLSDELKTAIVIRGIADPHVKAAASNAKLQVKDLVEFLSAFTKPKREVQGTRNLVRPSKPPSSNFRKRENSEYSVKCFGCGGFGHKREHCTKRAKTDSNSASMNSNVVLSSATNKKSTVTCTYCKKIGHSINSCFVKQRAETNNTKPSNVNFCRELKATSTCNILSAVIEKIPVDVLIDSGSEISLISKEILKHLNLHKNPTNRTMRGIGSQEIESTQYVTTVLEFPEIALEVDLYVVPADCISMPILIGTDVLNRSGVTYIRTGDKQRLTRVEESSLVFNLRNVNVDAVKTPLQGRDRERLITMIEEFSDHFITGTAASTVNTGTMEIKLNSETPVHYRPYKLSVDEKERVRKIVHELMDKGIIRESQSEYASPIILVKKKDGSDRMCVDYRALNAITIKERFPLPLIDDQIDKLGTSRYFSSLDMATGFHQVALKDDDSISKTAFVTPEGHFEYLKMPYGLANAPVVYQRIISKTLQSLIESGRVLNYIDDVLILSDTIEEGLDTLRKVLQTLTSAGFSINIKKCTFLDTEIEYLGRVISQGQVRPSPKKVVALARAPQPTNVKQVRQFLGLAGYFRRYIANFASKTACIAKLTKKGEPFIWGDEQEAARHYIVDCLTEEPVLAIFDPKLPTELHTDASAVGYGAILLQEHEVKRKRVVGYFSRATHGAESHYHSYELETLAIVKALQHFRHYLIGIDFKIVTDCNSLKLTEKKKDLVPRVARWWVYMQDFRFKIEYRKGVLMQHADFLSRNPVNVSHIRRPNNWARIAQTADSETQELMEKLRDGQIDSSRYILKNNMLYYKYSTTGEDFRLLCYIPKGHRLSLLRVFHDDHNHIGTDKTTDLILKHFWFPGLRHFVKKYVSHCVVCLAHKRVPRAPNQPIQSWSKPETPFSVIHADVLGPLPESNGFRHVLIVVDSFSKYCLLYTLYRQDTDDLKRVFTNAISLFGTPSLIVTDRGRMFESKGFQDWVSDMGCATHLITPGMHQENGQVERYCRTVLNMLRVEVNNKGSQWADNLWKIQLTLNVTRHATTQTSAMQLLIGVEAVTPVIRSLVRDVALENSNPNRAALALLRRQRASELLAANQEQQDQYVNEGRKQPKCFNVGDFVFVCKSSQSLGKLDSCMRGPYKVVKQLPHHRYELELLAGSYGKRTQAAAQYMKLWRGEWTPDACAAFFEDVGEDESNAGPSNVAALVDHGSLADEDAARSGEAVLENPSAARVAEGAELRPTACASRHKSAQKLQQN